MTTSTTPAPATSAQPITYSDEQRAIIEHRGGHLQVVACAGSGKTETVAQRIAELLAEGTAPGAVVAFTFTRAAAEELRARILRRASERMPGLVLERLTPMFVGTIHSWCLRLLQERAPRYATFDLYDTHRVVGLLLREYESLGLDELGQKVRVLAVRAFLRNVDVVENEDLATEALPVGPFRAIYERYLDLLDRYHVLTHAQCVSRALHELQHDEVLAAIRAELRHLVVDEFQDINPSQARLIRRLGSGPVSLCVVGDDDQAVYQWRGSSVAYLQTFQSEMGAERVTLGVNRRSVAPIVELAARFAQTIGGRLPKAITASRGDGPDAIHVSGARDPEHEAVRVARAIRALVDRGVAPSDIAILLRSTKNDAAPFLAALDEEGVPWRCTGREGLFLQPEAEVLGDLVAWLCGRDTFYRARQRREVSIALDELLGRLAATFALTTDDTNRLRAQLLKLRTALPQETAADLVGHLYRVLASLGVPSWQGEDTADRLGVLARFSQILADFEAVTRRAWTSVTDGVVTLGAGRAGGPAFLRALADYLSFYAQSAYEDFAGDLDATTPAVTVSTVHGAKGLQWPVVFVPCLNRDVFPSKMTGRKGAWLLPRELFPADRYEGSDDDERRLFYVAITRARDHLYLSLYQRDDGKPARASALLQGLLPGTISVTDDLPLPAVPPPAPAVPDVRLAVSYSALAAYVACPHRYWLASRLGFASPTIREAGYGRAVHHLLRRLAELMRTKGADPTSAALDVLVADEFYLPHADQLAWDALERRARRVVKTCLADWRDDLARHWAVERPLALHLDGADVEGRADVILDGEGGVAGQLAIVDYKTRPVEADDEAAEQLRAYSAAVRREGFTVRAAYLHDLTAAKGTARVAVDVRPEAVETSLRTLTNAAAQLGAGRFEAKPGARCSHCDFRLICRHALTED